ncbi:unnamed protein product, partial [Timema podura]|nr:unnamed protein product [Timema podura]
MPIPLGQLESEIAEEWILITEERNMATKAQLLSIVDMIVSFDMSHNAEIQACDLLMEIDEIDRLRDYIDASNYSRVCLYLISCALYVDKPEYIKIINLVLDFFLKFREYTRAMCLAMNLNDVKLMTRIFESCQDGTALNFSTRAAQSVFQGGISPNTEAWTSLRSSDTKLLQADDTAALEWLGSQGKVNRDSTWTGYPPGSKSPCDDDVLTVAARRSQTDPVAPSQHGLHCPDIVSIRKQLAFLLGRQQVVLDLDEFPDGSDLKTVMSNAHINDHFLNMARELDIMEPKTPEDVYKTWLENLVMRPTFLAESNVDSARKNLASTFVNAFVNAGFGSDKLVTGEDGKNWIYRNKEHGKMSAAASLGLIHLWDVDGGLSPIDRYLYSNDDYITSGALLALGIVNCGVRNECDPAQALLMDLRASFQGQTVQGVSLMLDWPAYDGEIGVRILVGSIEGGFSFHTNAGLGLAYAGSCRQDVVELIVPVLSDSHSTRETVAIAALACSLITVGFGSSEVTSPILQALMDMGPEDLENTYSRFLPLALGICYLGQ